MLRGITRGAVVIALLALAGASGCAVVDTYGDSTLDDYYSAGATIRANIQDNASGIGTRAWNVEVGTTMAGTRSPHSWASPRALSSGANVIVFSFGRNDSIDWARQEPGAYDSNGGKAWALNWINRARLAGASCVVWVTSNAGASWDSLIFDQTKWWQTDLNNWLASLGDTAYPDGKPIKLRLVSWGAIAARGGRDKGYGVHPNELGAAELGQAIRAQIKTCT